MQTITLTYAAPPGVSRSIQIRVPDFGNVDIPDPQQDTFPTIGGRRYTYDRGPEIRSFEWAFRDRLSSEKADVLKFFGADSANWKRRWFTVTTPLAWLEVLRCGGVFGGAVARAGAYVCGDRVAHDTISFQVKLTLSPVRFTETLEGCHDYELSLEVVTEPIPTNT